MRENDDDAPAIEPQGSLADGLGETAEPEGYETSGDPYGDTEFDDDVYGDTSDDTGSSTDEDDTSGDTSDTGADGTDPGDDADSSGDASDTYGDADSYGEDGYGTDGTYGDGSSEDADAAVDDVDVTVVDEDNTSLDDTDLVAQDNSPLEGIGFLIDEVREALLGDEDAAAASPFDTDPVDLETETDLDLTGDGVVDRADLHEAASSFDFGVSGGGDGHGHHDDGVIDT